MILDDIQKLDPTAERAVIINVGTKLLTTLALLSTLRHANMPVLLVDCQSKDGSWDHFVRMMGQRKFDLIAAPLRPHGETLDWIFRNIPAEKVLAVDSDLELLGPEIIEIARRFIDNPNVFGCGFTHGPCWMSPDDRVGYYQERLWMPMTMLKVSHIRQALDAGCSFLPKTIPNDCGLSRFVSRVLAQRFRFGPTRNWRLSWLDWLKGSYYGQKPCYVFCDTGAVIYQHLKYRRGLYFAGFPAEVQSYVTHFCGVTRLLLDPSDPRTPSRDKVDQDVRDRLERVYGFPVDERLE
jgi:hypothetical protein